MLLIWQSPNLSICQWCVSTQSLQQVSSWVPAALCKTDNPDTTLVGRSRWCRPLAAHRDASRSRADCRLLAACASGSCGSAEQRPTAPARLRALQQRSVSRSGSWNRRTFFDGLTCPECDDAANRIVRRNPDGDTIARHNLDTKTPHAAAQLGEHLVPRVRLDAIQPAAVHGHDRSLNVDEIVLAQPSRPFNQTLCHIH
jgi:hypothetical protein